LTEEKKSFDAWIRNLLVEYNQTIATLLPADDSFPLGILLQDLLKRLTTLFQLPEEKRTTTRLTAEISFFEQSLKTSSTLSSPSPTISALQCSLLLIFSYLLEYVIRSDSEEKILLFGHLSGAICRACGKIGGKVLYAFLCGCAMQQQSPSAATGDVNSMEDPAISSPLSIPVVSSSQQRKRLLLFYATQMGSVLAPARVDIAAGWAWLVRCGITISRFIHQRNATPLAPAVPAGNAQQSLAELCSALRGYLRIIGTDLQLTYGGRFMALVTVISSTLASCPNRDSIPELSDLQILLKEFLSSGRLPCVLFKQKDSYSIYASSVIR
jgi:hypothetical protein